MVKNSRRKKKAREAAASNGTNYTTELRAQERQKTAPELPEWANFPTPGSAGFVEAIDLAKNGVFRLGVTANNGFLDWDLNEQPHELIPGRAGAGKTIALNTVVAYGLALPDDFEVTVCDSHWTEYDWAAPHLATEHYAGTAAEIHRAVGLVETRLNKTLALLDKTGSRSLAELREKFRTDPTFAGEHGPSPKRTLLAIDSLTSVLATDHSNDFKSELQRETHRRLETIEQLGRKAGVHLICTTQRLDRKLLGPTLHAMDAFRLGIGPMDSYNATMLFGDTEHVHGWGTRLPSGRAVTRDSHGYREAQLYYVPARTNPDLDPLFLRGPSALDVVSYCFDG
ncbi:FtsK/SpoIIIE domain-containing protein [Dietzia maris]|uniref:FtsK/SpoIIIE domain-containing protein n=1 Tax=Dietzia maris TaxID=37915 RepID=UPI0037CAD5B8